VQRSFLELLHNKLAADGFFHAATDWGPYAEHMLEVLNESADLFSNTAANDFVERPEERPLTKFEQRGIRLGHGVWDLIFKGT
jgi:tRNA (guanine-N7-)-methyltransferase